MKISPPVLILVALSLTTPAWAERVGAVGAVNQSAQGTPPGGSARALAVGGGIENRERIETSASGSAQIVFNDTSTMTVGRNSAVTIDEFVYRGAGGRQGVSLAKGVMRFVGGGVSHEDGAQVRTPAASIGVRGGSMMARVGGQCATLVVHQYGRVTVTGSRNEQILTRSGFGVCVDANGVVSDPYRVPAPVVAEMSRQMSSEGKQTGGVANPPQNQEANLGLYQDRTPDFGPGTGLEVVIPQWAGNAIVQSGANAGNQPAPTAAPPAQEDNGYTPGTNYPGNYLVGPTSPN
jgi:hypothetical protein